jgi:hypothetical protein
MPGQLPPRAAGSDPAETLARTLVRPVDRRCGNDTRDLLQAPARTRLARIELQAPVLSRRPVRARLCPARTSGRTSIGYWLAGSSN